MPDSMAQGRQAMFDVLDCDQPAPGWYIVDAGGDLLNGPYPGPGEAWDSADELPWPEIDGIMWIGESGMSSTEPIALARIAEILASLNQLHRKYNPLIPVVAERVYGPVLAELPELDPAATAAADGAGRHDVVVLLDGTWLRYSAVESKWVTGPVSDRKERAYTKKWGES